jgi:Ca2+-binding RTX toxin-like protein
VRRLLSVLAVAAALTLVSGPGIAVPEGSIAIRGPASGTYLRLSVDGHHLFVSGPMADLSRNCHFTRGNSRAVCALRGVGSIEIETGPSDDKVEVLNRLPTPLTVYLGNGSDKLIGNAEADICFPQGTPRNRCIGGGGNDICVSAPINTDCVGEGGDDYCKTSDGSDGCWGGPGRDVCIMGAGHDGCHGEGGADKLYGGRHSDRLYGGGGDDHCDGGPGVGYSQECEGGPRR